MPRVLPANAARNTQRKIRSRTAHGVSMEDRQCHAYHTLARASATARKRAPISQPQPSPDDLPHPAEKLDRLARGFPLRVRPFSEWSISKVSPPPGSTGRPGKNREFGIASPSITERPPARNSPWKHSRRAGAKARIEGSDPAREGRRGKKQTPEAKEPQGPALLRKTLCAPGLIQGR